VLCPEKKEKKREKRKAGGEAAESCTFLETSREKHGTPFKERGGPLSLAGEGFGAHRERLVVRTIIVEGPQAAGYNRK